MGLVRKQCPLGACVVASHVHCYALLASDFTNEADNRDKARRFIALYDQQKVDPSTCHKLHRESVHLASIDTGCLGVDLRKYVDGEEMSLKLRIEIAAYQLCHLDHTMQESPHSARASKLAWRSSSLRL